MPEHVIPILTVAGDSSTLSPELFDCTFAVAKPIPVHVRGGDLARPAAVPRVGRGKAKAKSLSKVESSVGSCERSADGGRCSGAWAA